MREHVQGVLLYALAFGLVVGIVVLAFWLRWSVWDECRDAGFSVLYCLQR